VPQDQVFSIVLNNGLALSIATFVGYMLKNKFPKFNNQAIPITNFAVQFLGALILQIKPADAASLNGVANAAQNVLLQSVFVTALASGAQSSLKATGRTFLAVLKKILLDMAAASVAKAGGQVAGDPDKASG
jgi:hypothetical protein